MTAGARDTFITFEVRETTQDETYGTTVEGNWLPVSSAWAEVQDALPSRSGSVEDGVSLRTNRARVRVDYFEGIDVTASMRIDIDGRKLAIVAGPAHKRDSSEWEFMAEEITTRGDEA